MLRDKLSKSNNLQWYRATKISILWLLICNKFPILRYKLGNPVYTGVVRLLFQFIFRNYISRTWKWKLNVPKSILVDPFDVEEPIVLQVGRFLYLYELRPFSCVNCQIASNLPTAWCIIKIPTLYAVVFHAYKIPRVLPAFVCRWWRSTESSFFSPNVFPSPFANLQNTRTRLHRISDKLFKPINFE
jgi:hypothetical protein